LDFEPSPSSIACGTVKNNGGSAGTRAVKIDLSAPNVNALMGLGEKSCRNRFCRRVCYQRRTEEEQRYAERSMKTSHVSPLQ
jgi:hypothetical protein